MPQQRIAIVTGANRGLGLGTSYALAGLGYRVVMVGRDQDRIEAALEGLKGADMPVEGFVADVRNTDQVAALRDHIAARHGRADVLVNNAGAFFEPADFSNPQAASVLSVSPDVVASTFDTNTLGALRLCQAIVPLMQAGSYGRIVNLSSGMGQLSDMNGFWPGYRLSKTALNALTRILADELNGSNIKVNSVCPGWVRTDMGGPNATRGVDEAVPGIVWAATLPDDGPSGGFFRDMEPIPW